MSGSKASRAKPLVLWVPCSRCGAHMDYEGAVKRTENGVSGFMHPVGKCQPTGFVISRNNLRPAEFRTSH